MIHPSAIIEQGASLAENVEVGAFTIVHSGTVIGAGTRIGSHCALGAPTPLAEGERLLIGEGSHIRSHSVLYAGSAFGMRLETGHAVTIRERTYVGTNLRVGTLSDIQGDVEIGDYVRIHSNVFLGKGSRLGSFVWIFPFTVLTNDPTPPSDYRFHKGPVIGDYAVVAAMCCIAPGVTIGAGAFVAAMTMVTKDVDSGSAVRGSPARAVGAASDIKLRDQSGDSAYPWIRHFRRGFPTEVTRNWITPDDA